VINNHFTVRLGRRPASTHTAIRQRLYRDPDPRLRRSLAVALLCSALLVVGLLVVVGLRVQQVHLAYQLDALRGERARIEVLVRQLEIEVATLRSPGRVETRARQLGMTVPGREQVRLAREYVPGGSSGVASARLVSSESVIR
jgi:cell division protein FtsL